MDLTKYRTGRLTVPAGKQVAMRLYGQGLGDCFLLAFRRAETPLGNEDTDPCYVVIDCGVAKGTPDAELRMRGIVTNILYATGGTVDVLAVTHEHYDHVIGFHYADEEWNKIAVNDVWLPWTEDAKDTDAQKLLPQKKALAQAADSAIKQGFRFGMDEETLATLRAEASFLGLDDEEFVEDDFIGEEDAEFGADKKRRVSTVERGFKLAKGLKKNGDGEPNPTYCEPGDVRALPGSGARAFVLGPPRFVTPINKRAIARGGTDLVKLLVLESELYHYANYGLVADGESAAHTMAFDESGTRDSLVQGLMGVDETAVTSDDFQRYCPFDANYRMDWDEALLEPFFWKHYTSGPDWRRVDSDWLGGASDFALRAGSFINNISLVLAFELPEKEKDKPETKEVLLFVGDAQVGNWLSWDFIEQWTDRSTGKPLSGTPDMDDLLGRVTFYKVGHHGSHNATIKEKGLERMATKSGRLTAYIPVSVPVAQDICSYCPMPFYPLLRALQEKTEGRVFLANGELLQPLPPGTNAATLSQDVRKATVKLPAKEKDGVTLEEEVPLYIDVVL
jgi:hypothetical protein